MLLYHTTLFSNDPPGAAFVSRGAAWSFEKEPGVYHGPPNEMHDYSMKLFEQRGHAATGNYGSDKVPLFFDMEIMIRAQKLAHATGYELAGLGDGRARRFDHLWPGAIQHRATGVRHSGTNWLACVVSRVQSCITFLKSLRWSSSRFIRPSRSIVSRKKVFAFSSCNIPNLRRLR
jgi:hypothetical protein